MGLLLLARAALPALEAHDVSARGSHTSAIGAILLSPATWLFVTCAATPALLREDPNTIRRALRLAVARWWPAAVTTVAFLALGALMTVSGMASVLAEAASRMGRAATVVGGGIDGVAVGTG